MHQTSTGTNKTKKTKIQQILRSGPIVPGFFSFFVWCVCRFGASSESGGLFLFFFGACAGLVALTSQNIDRPKKKIKPLDAPNIDRHKKNKKSSNYPEVDPKFLFFFFLVPVQVWCI